jgi:type IV secretory pathway VirB9-like protein
MNLRFLFRFSLIILLLSSPSVYAQVIIEHNESGPAPIISSQPLVSETPPVSNILDFLRQLQFRYRLTSSSCKLRWIPSRVFDDGTHVYIQMPNDYAVQDVPALFLVHHNEPMLANYRFVSGFFMVDQLFDQAELVLDVGKKQEWVRIKKQEK